MPIACYSITMNSKLLSLALGLFALCLPVALAAEETDVKEMPTEISEPPYEVGELPQIQGYYIERGEELPSINFRIVRNKLRIYWIDADGLIAEPETTEAIVRFRGSVKGRPYHKLSKLSGDAGLGSPGIMSPPHLYNVSLNLKLPGDAEYTTYAFRYTPSMDKATDPEIPSAEDGTKTKSK